MQRQGLLRRLAALLVLLAMLCSIYVAVVRVNIESEYKNVNISVNETDVRTLANGNDKSNAEMLSILKEKGVSQILFKETTVGGLEQNGQVLVAKGQAVQTLAVSDQLPENLEIDPANYYVVVTDEAWSEQVLQELEVKAAGTMTYAATDTTLAVAAVPSSIQTTAEDQSSAKQALTLLGVGFDKDWMQEVADAGFGIVAQVSSWKMPTDEGLKLLSDDIKAVPNLEMLMFNSKYVPGYPKDIETFYQCILDEDGNPVAPIGQIEFSDQKGFNELAMLMDKNVVRLHTISDSEMSKFEGDTDEKVDSGIADALDRWELAARERNMRSLLVRFFDIDLPGALYEENMAYLDNLSSHLEEDGFVLDGGVQDMASTDIPDVVRLLIGFGICAGFYLMMLELRLPRLGLLGAAVAAAAWIVLYLKAPTLGAQCMALASVIEFPILSCLMFLPTERVSLPKAILKLLLLCAVSAIGALLMVGVMSDKIFMLKLSQFVGIKLAHVVPLFVVPFVLYICRADKPLATMKWLLNKALDYKWSVVFAIIALAMIIYVSRTGNTTAELSSGEAGMRQLLTDVMGVRPRSKEFLIGYPMTLLYLMYGKDRPVLWFLTLPLIIGQVSLVNTYAHIHTPLLISLQRSFNGLLLGIVVGIVVVLCVKAGIVLWKKAIHWLESREGVAS